MYAELNEKAKAATSSFSATGDFLQYIFTLCLWLRIGRRSDKGVLFMNFPSHIF